MITILRDIFIAILYICGIGFFGMLALVIYLAMAEALHGRRDK